MRKTAGGVTTHYLVEDRNPTGYAQVVAEHADSGAAPPQVTRVYVIGLNLVSQDRFDGTAWQANFYGYDGHGSVCYLTDGSGQVIDTCDYDAFMRPMGLLGGGPAAGADIDAVPAQ